MKKIITPCVAVNGRVAGMSSLKHAFALASVIALSACAGMQNPSPSEKTAPAIPSMEEWMGRGDLALKGGDHTKARAAWRSAAKDYPSATQPWLKLSEDYFYAGDYGNAVLASQEALQRDPKDRTANSVLAVSGLRLTAGSLAALREDGPYAVGSRSEAIAVTRSLREALGEPVLVPQAESASARKRPARAVQRAPVLAADASPAGGPPPAAGNPLDKLK